MLRVIQTVKPTWIVGENVTGIISLGIREMLADLENIGYDSQTFIIFLTNRVHPFDTGKIVRLRGKVANIVASSILKD